MVWNERQQHQFSLFTFKRRPIDPCVYTCVCGYTCVRVQVPNLIFQIEQFEKLLIRLSKAAGTHSQLPE